MCLLGLRVKTLAAQERVTLKKIGFVGAGQMAKALALGIAKSKTSAVQFTFSDPSDAASDSFEELISPHSPVQRATESELGRRQRNCLSGGKAAVSRNCSGRIKLRWKFATGCFDRSRCSNFSAGATYRNRSFDPRHAQHSLLDRSGS